MKSKQLLTLVTTIIDDMKGKDSATLDIRKMSTIADYMVVVTATSSRHAKSVADELQKRCKAAGVVPRSVEGLEQSEWILVDLSDVIVHVMQAATRKLYDLESLWRLSPAE